MNDAMMQASAANLADATMLLFVRGSVRKDAVDRALFSAMQGIPSVRKKKGN
jgi:hypothetical protein